MTLPPETGYPYLDAVREKPGSVLAFAHRGGALHPDLIGLENTHTAFAHAVSLGYSYLETDVHVTADGVLVAFHDSVLDRVTDQRGPIAALTHEEVSRARIGGKEPIPTMESLLVAFPTTRFNIDLKSPGAVQPLVDLIDRLEAHDRVMVGSFGQRTIERFRRITAGRVATSAGPAEVVAFLATVVDLPFSPVRRLVSRRYQALQIPHRRGPVPIATRRLVRNAHAVGIHVHVWTVDEPDDMLELIDAGVDGLMTDRTDLLAQTLRSEGRWTPRH